VKEAAWLLSAKATVTLVGVVAAGGVVCLKVPAVTPPVPISWVKDSVAPVAASFDASLGTGPVALHD